MRLISGEKLICYMMPVDRIKTNWLGRCRVGRVEIQILSQQSNSGFKQIGLGLEVLEGSRPSPSSPPSVGLTPQLAVFVIITQVVFQNSIAPISTVASAINHR